jgi:hypothetical protein
MAPVARLGVMRLGASRLNTFQPWIRIFIDGTDRTANVRVEGVTIVPTQGHDPDTASLRVAGFVPQKGQEITVFCGDEDFTHQMFGGHILAVDQGYEDVATNVVYDLSCIDYTWLLDRRKVIKRYTNQSATAIVLNLMATYTSGFTTAFVQAGLPTLDEITFTNESVSDALTRVAERIGAYWYIDYAKGLHFYTTDEQAAGTITDANTEAFDGFGFDAGAFYGSEEGQGVRTARNITESADLSQVATRVWSRGGGSPAVVQVAAGSTILPVEDGSWYSATGGYVESGPQRITYTGIAGSNRSGSSLGSYVPAPANTMSVAPEVTGFPLGSMDAGATYGYAVTYVTPRGETTPSATASGTADATSRATRVTSIPVPADGSGVTSKNLYRTEGGGSTLKFLAVLGVSQTSVVPDTYGDGSLGTAQPPVTNTAFTEYVAQAGATSLTVDNLAVFSNYGWAEIDGQIFYHTNRSATSGQGQLLGIPSSGIGSLTAPVRSGTVRVVPYLTGIPASGAGAIVYPIAQGDEVSVLEMREDEDAQDALAALTGGDGIVEEHIADGRLSATEAGNRAEALLAERKDPITTIRFDTRDQSCQPGRNVTIELSNPAISGTFRIQRVTISQLGIDGGRQVFPLRSVEASSKRYSFEDLLRQIRGR